MGSKRSLGPFLPCVCACKQSAVLKEWRGHFYSQKPSINWE